MTSLDIRSNSAVMKRAEQLKRWEESETNQASCVPRPEKGRKIKFSSGCVFLAACSSGDKDEVLSLLENGADINTANVDGLTALHQACIDDNLEMVEFLVEHGADINRQDNEGWTPLHATASCGFVSIARYLVEHGADVAAVNSDGDLAVDLAVDIQHMPMIEYMQKVVNDHSIDLQKARDAELDQMLKDAKQWLRSDASEADRAHPKTGATALHVAAAKGYTKVLSLLLAGRVNVDKQDNDGWTPLHAAAHWGQKEAAEMLVNAMADMDIRNYSGLTCIDVAERKMVKFLEELRANNKRTKRRPSSQIRISDTIENHNPGSKIIRVEMKPDQTKEQANGETIADASATLSQKNINLASIEISNDSDETDSEHTDSTESSHSTSLSATEDDKPMPTSESSTAIIAQSTDSQGEDEAPWRRNSLARMRTPNDSPTKNQVPEKDVSKTNTITETSDVILRRTQSFENDDKFYQKYKELRARITANSCPILPAEISNSNNRNSNSNISNKNKINSNNNNTESKVNRLSSNAPPSSVAFARLYLTTSSASTISPAIATSTTSTSPITSTTTTTITTNLNTPVQTNNVQRSASLKDHRSIRKQLTSPPASPANVITTSTLAYTTTTNTNTAATSGTPIRRSFVPPVRDEESETQRKAHAKRVRETRRSTQGVTLDEIKSAEELVKKKNANMNNNNNSGNNTDTTKQVSSQENIPSLQQQTDGSSAQPEVLISMSTSSTNEKEFTKDITQFEQLELLENLSSSCSAILHSNIIAHDDNECGNDNNINQESEKGEPTDDISKDESNVIIASNTNVRIIEPNSYDKITEIRDDDEDNENEIIVNFTIKHPDKVILPTPTTTIESVEETVVVPHAVHKRTVAMINDSDSKGKSFHESEIISPQTCNETVLENQSDAYERDSDNNFNNSTNIEKTDFIEKPTSNPTSSSSSSTTTTTTTTGTTATTATTTTLHIQGLDNNVKINEQTNLSVASSCATTTAVVKNKNAGALSPSTMSLPIQAAESGEIFTSASSTPTLESPVRLRDKRLFLDFERRSSEPATQNEFNQSDEVTTSINVISSNASRNGSGDADSLLRNNTNSIPSSSMTNCREATISAGSNVNTSSYSGISMSERRPSWRLKLSNDSKFKLEDVNTGSTYPPINSTIIPSAPAVIAAANQRRINSVGNAINSSNQSLNSIGRPVSSPPTAVISHANNNTGSNFGPATTPSGDNIALYEEPDNNRNNTVNVIDRKYNVVSTPASSATPTTVSSGTNSTAKNNKEDEKDQGNDGRTALATQAVIQRRRKPKRRSTGVVHLDMDDLDPERQDSANDADDKESGSEQRSSRSRVGSTASNSNNEPTTKTDTKSQNKSDNGEPDYKALWQAARLENDQLKLELLKKDEQLVQTNSAMSRITNATSKNSLSELEKRERRAMERKLSELEEELKLLQKLKTENERLRAENRALTRVVSKLTSSAQSQLSKSK